MRPTAWLIILSFVAASVTSLAAAADSTQLGVLTCKSIVGTRVNLIFRSTTDIYCEFRHADGKVEHYLGETGIALGADLTFAKDEESFAFAVLSAEDIKVGTHALAGKYIGGKASASLGLGIGAAALVGGSNKNFALNPLALEGNTGFGASAGIGFLYIEKAR
jgi:hypothetical protein